MTTKKDVEPVKGRWDGMRTALERISMEATSEKAEFSQEDLADFMESIFTAQTAEEVFANQELTGESSKTFLNTPFWLDVNGVTWVKSTIENGSVFPYYARLKVSRADSETELTVSAGGNSVIAAISRLQDIGYLDKPQCLQFVEKATSGGNTVVKLMPVAVAKPRNAAV